MKPNIHPQVLRGMFIVFKKHYQSFTREVLYKILVEFVIPMELVRLIKMYLNENSSRVRVDKYFPDMFPIKNGLKQGDTSSPLLFSFTLSRATKRI
jgi:hypothetical protein